MSPRQRRLHIPLSLLISSLIIHSSICSHQKTAVVLPPDNHHHHHNHQSIQQSSSLLPQQTTSGGGDHLPASQTTRCQEITIPMCKSIRYNYTELPNAFNHETQEEAGLEVHQYWPLVEIKCSEDLKFFICSLYVPICMEDYAGTVPPCRSVCERARAGCQGIMSQYGFQWPERMACDQFPKFGKNSICMDEKGGEEPSINNNNNNHPIIIPIIPTTKVATTTKKPKKNCTCSSTCPYPLIKNIKNSSSSSLHKTNPCALPCHGYEYDSPEETRFANYWILTWSSITCFFSTLTVLTFLIDSNRFNYPERPIILISFCYIFVSLGYLIRIYYGHETVACSSSSSSSKIIRYPYDSEAKNNNVCYTVFLLTYFFTLSGCMWYLNLTIAWYLASVLKWSTEAISEKSGAFHVTVWVSSAIISLIALVTNRIDGDSVSGICYVGNQDRDNLLAFVLIPMGGLLLIATVFLISGFVSLVRIRRVISREVRNIHKLEKLMIRIGVFGVLWVAGYVVILGGFVYESWWREEWIRDHSSSSSSSDCVNCNVVGGLRVISSSNNNNKPLYSVLMIKHFMSLATGLTASIWVFSSKTIETWKVFFWKLMGCSNNNSNNRRRRTGSSNSTCSNAATSILISNKNQTHV